MALINFATREIAAKIVYFGATGAGSNTNVRRLFELVPARSKSRLHAFGASESSERTWYFDYVPASESVINGFQIRFRVYSLPGGVVLPAHRAEVMKGVDGLVFVADARPDREARNLESLLELERALSEQGVELAAAALVFEVNHGDAPDARNAEDVVFDLNPYGFPVHAAIASEGTGVQDAHGEIARLVSNRVRDALSGIDTAVSLSAVHRAEQETDEQVIRAHIDAIQSASSGVSRSLLADTVEKDRPAAQDPFPDVEIPWWNQELSTVRPIEVIGATLVGETIRVELVLAAAGVTPKRGALVLTHRLSQMQPASNTGRSPASVPSVPPIGGDATPKGSQVGDFLPQKVEYVTAPAPEEDYPGILYGILGVLTGIVIGLLTGYLVGFF